MFQFNSTSAFDNWYLESLDDPTELLQGQFPTEPTQEISSSYAQHKALNRASPIIQFLNGAADTVSFEARFYAIDSDTSNVKSNVDQLIKWAKRDDNLNRPHRLKFYVGDGHLEMSPCVITSLGGIKYSKPTKEGGVREITLTINLLSYNAYDLDIEPVADTRYHRSKVGDYYEMLSYREYGTTDFGDAIRVLHPTKPNLQTANIVKLPSRNTLQKTRPGQKSLQLKTAYGKKETAQRTLRLELFDRTNRTYVSHIIKE